MNSRAALAGLFPVAALVFVAGCVQGPEGAPRVKPPALSRAEADLQPPGGAAGAFTDATSGSGVSPP